MDQQGKVLWNAMKNNPMLHLTAIFTDIRNVVWAEEFARVMRPFYTAEDFQADLDFSKRHFTRCQKEFGPKRVSIIDTARLPLFPVIMIDNTLVVGHYAHSEEISPDGLWFTIHHPKISLMYESLLAGNSPLCETPEEKALIRYVHELIVETVNNDKETMAIEEDSKLNKSLARAKKGIGSSQQAIWLEPEYFSPRDIGGQQSPV